jgi:hypothetical protein
MPIESCRAEYRHAMAAAPLSVWRMLADFGSLLSWVAGGDEGSIELSGEGVGMTRDLWLPSVGRVQHRLDALDESNRVLTYSLTEGRPLGMQRYSVTLGVEEAGSGCTLAWQGTFVPEPGADADAMAENLQRAYADMSRRLDAMLRSA